jgi:GNAT superfamily N-acetyltransferase
LPAKLEMSTDPARLLSAERMSALRVMPATAEWWPQLGRVFGAREKDPTSCWCQRFRRHEERDNRGALEREVHEADLPVGLLAYLEGEVVGWTRVVPRSTLPGITEHRALARVLDEDPDAWWVSCFVVRREHRGSGIGVALLKAAVGWAAQHGASVLDGHPVDTGGLAGTPSPSAIFTGTLAMFQQAGFAEIGRTYRTRPVMRRELGRPC